MAIIYKGMISATINGITINSSLPCNLDNLVNKSSRDVKYIVMHYTGNEKDTAKANANYFRSPNRKASAHFFVDDSNIYQSVELRDVAWHCGGSYYYHNSCRNANSFGIEMCCTAGNYTISAKTLENSAQLCAYLCKLLGIGANQVDTYVLRHYDITHKKCPAQMANSANDADWTAFKNRVKAILNNNSTSKPVINTTTGFKSYLVKVNCSVLNVRAGAGTGYKVTTSVKRGEVYTIVGEAKANGYTWGKLKSGAGWIALEYTKKV